MFNLNECERIDKIHGDTIWHHSRDKIEFFDLRSYEQLVGAKPRGIWMSFKRCDENMSEWESFCVSHKICISSLKNKSQIAIYQPKDKPFIIIKNGFDCSLFQQKYGKYITECHPKIIYIDWQKVSQDYSGIIIYEDSPFSLYEYGFTKNSAGIGLKWLDKWSVYSGCIWHPELVKLI